MPALQKVIQLAGKALPKVVSPSVHTVADYSTAGLFFVGSALFWRRSKRAAVASLICGAAKVAVAALTDYPGGVKHAISFPCTGRSISASPVWRRPQCLSFSP